MPAANVTNQNVTVQIGDHLVGTGQRTLIIAEAGVNHDGSLDKALQMVDVAAQAGADVIKFQVFRADDLATAAAPAAAYQEVSGVQSQRDMLRRLELRDDDLMQIQGRCQARGIAFLATPFGPVEIDRLCDLGVPALKIASTDLNNVPFLRKAAETGLPLIVSTGASTEGEIMAAVDDLRNWGAGRRTVLLHCISGYPAPLNSANLRAIVRLGDMFEVPAGFSDHTTSTDIAGWAVAAGACVLEKHFTLDPSASGPDHAMSLDPERLALYVAAARQAEIALGDGDVGMTAVEDDVRTKARKSVVAAQRIPAGQTIAADMLSVKRPAGGIEPRDVDQLVGRQAAVDIEADTLLTWDMVR